MATFSDTQLAAIIKGSGAFNDYPLPGINEEGILVAVRCLSEGELDGCRIEAQVKLRKYAKKRGWDVESLVNIDPELHTRLIQRSIIARAFFDPDTTKQDKPAHFFTGEEQVEELGSVQTERLFAVYLEHQEWANPRRELTKDEAQELVEVLGKEHASQGALSGLGRDTLVSLCISLASKLRSI